MNVCPRCGQQVMSSSKFCAGCGAPVGAAPGSAASPPKFGKFGGAPPPGPSRSVPPMIASASPSDARPGLGAPTGYVPSHPVVAPMAPMPGTPMGGPMVAPSAATALAIGGRPLGKVRPPFVTLLLAIVTCGIYGLMTMYQCYEEMYQFRKSGISGGVGLIIGILLAPVTLFLFPNEIKACYEIEGRKSPVSAATGLWFLLPFLGALIWFFQVHGALNRFWQAHGVA